MNQQPGFTYTAEACDNHDSGAGKDTFSIIVTGPNFFYSNSGKHTSGNVQIHTQ